MQNVVLKEGPRAPLFYSVATVLLLVTNVTQSQSVDLSSLQECASLETPDLKLACFEAIIEAHSSSNAQIPGAAPVTSGETAPTVDSEINRTAAQAPIADSAPESDPSAGTMAAAETVPIVKPKNASPAVEPSPEDTGTRDSVVKISPEPVAEFGAEQLPERNRDSDQTIRATVVDVRQGYNRTLSFYMADGQVWRQIEPRRLQYPKNEEFEVIISQGMLGEYRLRIGENGRLVKIRRIK
jgi:hypothetical protein